MTKNQNSEQNKTPVSRTGSTADLTAEESRIYEEVADLLQQFQDVMKFDTDIPRDQLHERATATRALARRIDEVIAGPGKFIEIKAPSGEETTADALLRRYGPLLMRKDPSNVFVAIVDTETTGLGLYDEPVSIGILLVEATYGKGVFVQTVNSLYALREPHVTITPEAQSVHGLSIDDLRGKKWDMSYIGQMLSSADYVVAHNAKFDRRILANVLTAVEDLEWACSIQSLKYEWPKITGGPRSLDAICDALKIIRPEPHNALSDCYALLEVLKHRAGKTERSSTLMGRLMGGAWVPPFEGRPF